MDLKNWEFFEDGTAVIGATVKVRDAVLSHPNTNTVLASTVVDSNGMWAFTGLTDTAKDVEVLWGNVGQYHRWYKGMSAHNIGTVFFDSPIRAKEQTPGSLAAPGTGTCLLYPGTDDRWYARCGTDIERRLLLAGTITTADIATGGVIAKRQLNYVAATDLWNGTTLVAGSNTDLNTNQSFTVDDANSVVAISVRGSGILVSASAATGLGATYILVDGVSRYRMGGSLIAGSADYHDLLGGDAFITGLSAGTHNVRIQGTAALTNLPGYCRAATQSATEGLEIQVLEFKR
jgi:hypothetical protein